jgi:hypothetical protein
MRKKILFSVILLVSIYLLAELFSFVLFWVTQGTPFSFSQFQADRRTLIQSDFSPRPVSGSVMPDLESTSEVIHPYLGFVIDPTSIGGYSELGFPGKNPVHVVNTDKDVIIGIFGGSFAEGLSRLGGEALISELSKAPGFQGKDMGIYTFALGGYKQPQQLFTLTYLLFLGSDFDIVINIDGFNEIALPSTENIPKQVFPFYPRRWFTRVGNLSDTTILTMLGELSFLRSKRQSWASFFVSSPLHFSISANMLWRFYDSRLSQQQIHTLQKFLRYKTEKAEMLGYVATGQSVHYANNAEMYEDLALGWKSASLQMHRLAEANKANYFHILQPNQYVPNAKMMIEKELNIAISEDQPYRQAVEEGYTYLIQQGKQLTESGVNFHDLTMIFSENDDILYADNCCHLNEKGYRIIGSEIGQTIGAYYDKAESGS